ncbi:MAG TPA: DUF2889 domain-containing protein [Mycobacteriales bacterium]|nr:DUF2889 domain-containing protein [Mycobacteriales bacterium]
MDPRAVRSTMLTFDPQARVIAGEALDTAIDAEGAETVIRRMTLRAQLDNESRLVGLDTLGDAPTADLIGRRVASGFRAATSDLTGTPEHRLLRRMLWDLPIAVMVGMQPRILDHPATTNHPQMILTGVDQCSGWRAGGEMLTRIADAGGVLRMPLGPELDDPAADALAPLQSRRARSLTVTARAAPSVRATFRDSYADPDGIARRLHEWVVEAALDQNGTLGTIQVEPGRLPWAECPFAAHSATRLIGRRPDEIETAVAEEFVGTTTCTHLNDTLRTLAEVPDLLV